jgi:hypothetical protein
VEKIKKRITMKELIERGLVPWGTPKTVVKKIKDEEFPGILVGGNWYFEIEKVDLWFKRHEYKAG